MLAAVRCAYVSGAVLTAGAVRAVMVTSLGRSAWVELGVCGACADIRAVSCASSPGGAARGGKRSSRTCNNASDWCVETVANNEAL